MGVGVPVRPRRAAPRTAGLVLLALPGLSAWLER